MLTDEFNDGFDRARRLSGATHRWQLWSTKARLTVNVWGIARWCHEWSVGTGEDGGVDAKHVAGNQGVRQRARERRIAVHGGDADQIRVVVGHHQREDVIVSWVAVDDHRGAIGGGTHGRTLAHPPPPPCFILHA